MAGLLEEEARAEPSAAHGFKSSRGCKVAWSLADVQAQAKLMSEMLPKKVHDLVGSSSYTGGPIINYDNVLSSPTRVHLKKNACWLKAVVTIFKSSVPSGYFLADSLLELDKVMGERLLRPSAGQCKLTLALQEAAKLKKLAGHLRYLYRNTSKSKHHLNIKLRLIFKQPLKCQAASQQKSKHEFILWRF